METVVYVLARMLAFLPLPFLFVLSDVFLYPLVYYVARYRLRVVRTNLKNAFPEKAVLELRKIERTFYRHFCDLFLETLRILCMSEREARKRVLFTNPEVLTDISRKGQGVLIVLGHYGNWEYQNFFYFDMLESGNSEGYSIYRPLKNKAFDRLFLKMRTKFGCNMITKNDSYRTVIRLRREGKSGVIGLISDQSPSGANLHYWTTFLNQETSILTGPERIAKQTDYAVIYADVEKRARGYYRTTFRLITDAPRETKENEITEKYVRLMEETILREPSYWLWTHKRWKHKRREA